MGGINTIRSAFSSWRCKPRSQLYQIHRRDTWAGTYSHCPYGLRGPTRELSRCQRCFLFRCPSTLRARHAGALWRCFGSWAICFQLDWTDGARAMGSTWITLWNEQRGSAAEIFGARQANSGEFGPFNWRLNSKTERVGVCVVYELIKWSSKLWS